MTDEYRTDWQNPEPAGVYATTTDDYVAPTYDQAAYEPPTYEASTSEDDQGKAGAAKEQAAAVGQGAAQAGQQVASVAKDQAQNVAAEAGNQAKDLMAQAKSELTDQASTQQGRLAEMLRSLAAELDSMVHHDGDQGMATNLAQQASARTHDAASWLESGEPDHLLKDVQAFARKRPAAFLALAAGAGVLAGRLGRGVKDAGSDDAPTATGSRDTTVTRAEDSVAASYQPDHSAAPVVASRPFASSQVEDYPTHDSSAGL